jgi:hypothetical protein
MTERLYSVGVRNKRTGERFSLDVWADTNEHATSKLLNSLIGIDKPYAWTGTGPVYVDNHTVEREVTP